MPFGDFCVSNSEKHSLPDLTTAYLDAPLLTPKEKPLPPLVAKPGRKRSIALRQFASLVGDQS
jgi:hypothetical protein